MNLFSLAGLVRKLSLVICVFLYCSSHAGAQQQTTPGGTTSVNANPVAVPDAPKPIAPQQPQTSAAQPSSPEDLESSEEGRQTKRILGIFPNFRSVSVNARLPAQSPKEKFVGFAQDSFDYSSFILLGLLAGVTQLQGSTPEFHTGAPAFGRYYWHTFADQTDENFWVGFLLPVALHQDARYYTLGRGTPGKHNGYAKRAGYALSRILITRTDSGENKFNYSEVVGAGVAAGISNFYYPSSNRGLGNTVQRWGLNVGIDGGVLVLKEFWPDINKAVFHRK